MLRSDTILHLICIWSTLFVSLRSCFFFSTNHFLLDLMVTETLRGLSRNMSDFCFVLVFKRKVSVSKYNDGLHANCLFCVHGVQPCQGKQQNNNTSARAIEDMGVFLRTGL